MKDKGRNKEGLEKALERYKEGIKKALGRN